MPLITLDDVSMAFGHVPLLDHAGLQVDAGERVAVIGRNGTGKSTLLKILSGEIIPDAGTIWRAPSFRAARLVQDAAASTTDPVFDVVAEGLGELRDIVTAYHHAATELSDHYSEEAMSRLGHLQQQLEEQDGWTVERRIEVVLTHLKLPPDVPVHTLSGGWRRRVHLARALVAQPSLLLLDEPTNHLDIDSIEWLEGFLADYQGAIVFVTHDRAFLERLATRIVELDRGHVTSWPGTYRQFQDKKEAWLSNEALADARFDKKMAQEEVWLRRGVKARRTRDEGRVKALMAMRAERADRRAHIGNVRLQVDVADRSGHVVFEAEHVSKRYDGTPVIRDFSTRIMRKDRIGLIGPNGAGKTTLLRMLVGELAPDTGTIHQGTNVQIAYFDQQREQLDPERTVVDTVADGNDTVTINGVTRHVHGYLEDFLFPPERARSPVKALSGGERNRLLLAKLLTQPANVLILDEPTNDLDIETLELVEAELVAFSGTLLIVSHDRRFLNNVVTSTFAFESDGVVREYVGGYDDWLLQRAQDVVEPQTANDARAVAAVKTPGPAAPIKPARLSYKEKLELEALPARVQELEREQSELRARSTSDRFYREPAADIASTLARLQRIDAEIDALLARWDQLESRHDRA